MTTADLLRTKKKLCVSPRPSCPQALFTTMTTAIEFLLAFNFLVSHGILLKKQGSLAVLLLA